MIKLSLESQKKKKMEIYIVIYILEIFFSLSEMNWIAFSAWAFVLLKFEERSESVGYFWI